jgi:hypothetical protein
MLSMQFFPCNLFFRGETTRRPQGIMKPDARMILCNGEQVEAPSEVGPHSYLNSGERVRVKQSRLKSELTFFRNSVGA